MADDIKKAVNQEMRHVVPLSDDEIVQIYRDAKKQKRQRWKGLKDRAWRGAGMLDALTWILFGVVGLGFLFNWNDLDLALNQLLVVVVVALLAPFLIASQAPFGVFTLTELMTRKRKTNRTVDPHSIEVLEVVVEEFAQAPVRYYESLSERIEQTQASLNEALDSLPQMENSLAVELKDIEDEGVRALISNRIDRARRVRERLQELSEELNRQQKEAQEAIEPVVKVSEKFARLRMVGESLERITAAYDLADEAEEQVMERQYELQMLRSLSARALSRLREIDGLLTASQQARAELEAVQSVRSATEEEAEETEVRS